MKDIYEDMESLKRNIADQTRAITKQEGVRQQHQNDIKQLYKAIAEKDAAIGDRETKIFLLKRKT